MHYETESLLSNSPILILFFCHFLITTMVFYCIKMQLRMKSLLYFKSASLFLHKEFTATHNNLTIWREDRETILGKVS